ncbi:MAG: ABC transporter ATP-binding protein [Phycisphaerales bacterium]|nr:ABC transporter ATP-binding protein [Phycisphaerales bacterium]
MTGTPTSTPARVVPGKGTIRLRGIHKLYQVGSESVHALRGVSLDIARGEFVAIMGASGSGKSTLMNILGCLDQPSKGMYELSGRRTDRLGAAALAQVRNKEIGFVFQTFELLARSTALENVQLPLAYSARLFWGASKRAKLALERVGLGDRMHHRPSQLSGGQRQRVAVARALVNEPAMILADEPTGNLDSKTSEEIINLFKDVHKQGQTIVVVTHEEDIAGHAERIVRLRDGIVVSDHPTASDPMHRDYLERMAMQAARAASGESERGGTVAPAAGQRAGGGVGP